MLIFNLDIYFLGFVGGWKQELTMILMCSPNYNSISKSIMSKMFKKKYSCFKVIEDRLRKLLNKVCEPHEASQYHFKSTKISQEIIDLGFAPFDIKSCQPTSIMTDSDKRNNLKELIRWLCEQITTPAKPMRDDFDLLNEQEPSYYGLSCKSGKYLSI